MLEGGVRAYDERINVKWSESPDLLIRVVSNWSLCLFDEWLLRMVVNRCCMREVRQAADQEDSDHHSELT